MWVFRTMVVSDAVVDTCRSLAMLLAGEGQKLWTTPLSAGGTEPPTHWISSGMIEAQFGDLLPLSEWTWVVDNEDAGAGHWQRVSHLTGNPDLLSELSGGAATEAQSISIFNQCDVTMEDPQAAMARLDLQMVTKPEPEPFRPS